MLNIENIQPALLTAAGVSDKAMAYLLPQDRVAAIQELIAKYLEPSGPAFIEELVFRFLLTRGDALGGSMRNIGGAMAVRKLTRAAIANLSLADGIDPAGADEHWKTARTSLTRIRKAFSDKGFSPLKPLSKKALWTV